MSPPDLIEVSSAAPEVQLPHRCAGGAEAPIAYALGPRGRERLAAGETVPVTARCRRCEGRVFVSLVDPGARAVRRAAARPDPAALRLPGPARDPRTARRRARVRAGPLPRLRRRARCRGPLSLLAVGSRQFVLGTRPSQALRALPV
jgi:hypothetical protein